jgi:ribonuclease HII
MAVIDRQSSRPATRRSPGLHRPGLRLEKSLLRGGCVRLAAMDEVGRGALAGPVTVGVLVVTEKIGRVPAGLRDSKLLTPAARTALVGPVRRWAGEYAVGHASAVEIDAVGIMAAQRAAARRALVQLTAPVDALLLDGKHNYLAPPDPAPFDDRPDGVPAPVEEPVFGAGPVPPVHLKVKADLTCAAVAGASVLAKTERDRLLTGLDPYFPDYAFAVNKGYGTPEHLNAIRIHGPSVVHRRSWRLVGDDEGEPFAGRDAQLSAPDPEEEGVTS